MEAWLCSDELRVGISSLGAELLSVKRRSRPDFEYLWQGGPEYYPHRAIHIFPYVGRSTGGVCRLGGELYQMPLHGFAAGLEFDCRVVSESEAVFSLRSCEETRRMYPRDFVLTAVYSLEGSSLRLKHTVENLSSEPMYFGLGLHPGFNLPLEEGRVFGDYGLAFPRAALPMQVGMTEFCFRTGDSSRLTLGDGKTLPLSHSMFDNDALILDMTGGEAVLSAPGSEHSVTIRYPDMRYLSIWHTPKTEAPFLCVEPMTSLPARQDVVEALEAQEDLITLEPSGVFTSELVFDFK
ncbi:aldose 1-epimerase family protein [uncultured Gemmiger sp.]|jgi:galactose mutarotase-like enzyme|uniref:aldose 1-epimerase family protein n=1 Tax=uncultured Gemmiger sp. TaxID=1623490 RepID=UPI0026657EC6|nr:aldose 1-epimerase family protein [uncultured Gemmiger sp.]